MSQPWNHNLHYDSLVLSAMPAGCSRALDVGCGDGRLTRLMAQRCDEAVGMDVDARMVAHAEDRAALSEGVAFVLGDVLTYPFAAASFEFICLVATLHHLPLVPALQRCTHLLRPGGVLAVVGLYRPCGAVDHAWAAAGFAASRGMRCVRTVAEQHAPMQSPHKTLRQIRLAADTCLPGAVLRRRLFFRYSLLWQKS